mmetsp:Transcript_11238/g.28388  ORF Transcript_11238/g.28388 Transcript_11238/m.28388 type:complete len:222 (+) Transcript_11238:1082-1747(+)
MRLLAQRAVRQLLLHHPHHARAADELRLLRDKRPEIRLGRVPRAAPRHLRAAARRCARHRARRHPLGLGVRARGGGRRQRLPPRPGELGQVRAGDGHALRRARGASTRAVAVCALSSVLTRALPVGSRGVASRRPRTCRPSFFCSRSTTTSESPGAAVSCAARGAGGRSPFCAAFLPLPSRPPRALNPAHARRAPFRRERSGRRREPPFVRARSGRPAVRL